ncbi:hypothetical protein PBPRB1977 [Photobacterium profundum SS9]|uniref:Pilus assembly protein E-set like domain-containing protein n=2 Tax=Photobacterium profundum TaxID=74109 RepID=Q6LFV8_PHOPR|nr:hypothetical protein PBPRB1977 [Photobacterium profundum SS9]
MVNNKTAKLDSDFARIEGKKMAKTDLARKISDEIAFNRKTAQRNELFVSLYGEQFAEDLEGIPEEFLQIVYNQTFAVQLILGGQDIGQATLSISPAKSALSDINLTNQHKDYFKDDFDDGQLAALLSSDNLFTGIECDEFKQNGVDCKPDDVLLKGIFDKDNLNLYLYVTSELLRDEGISLVNAQYLSPPTTDDVTSILGYQLNTSASDYSEQYNLRLKGVVSKGEHNIIANTRFASESSQLDDIYYRYDMNGTGAKAGLLSTEKLGNDGGFTQTLLDSRQDLLGFEYGSSNKTYIKDESSSLLPVEIIMSRAGRVEIYKDSDLIDTQYINAGIARLNTSSFPQGNYLVDVRIYDGDTFVRSETKQVIKERIDFDQKYTVFGGFKFDRERDGDKAHQNKGVPMMGGMYQIPFNAGSALSLSAKLDTKNSQVGADWKQSLSLFNYSIKSAR